MRVVLLVLGVLMATPAMAADQFDLLCTAAPTVAPAKKKTGVPAKKVVTRYRVDLTRGQYCSGDCDLVRPINEVTDGMLIFEQEDPKQFNVDRIMDQVNRATGEWYRSVYFPRIISPHITEGTCQQVAFTGLPPAKY